MASASRLRVPLPQRPATHKGPGMLSIDESAPKVGKTGRPILLSFDETPEWFRHESNQWLYFHNESVNIYSHLVLAVVFLLGEWYIQKYFISTYSGVTSADIIAFSIFMLAAVMCLSMSATYHTLMNLSQHVEHLCLRLDMLGVVMFILGDLVLGIHMDTKYRLFHALMFVATSLCGVAPLIHGLRVFGMTQMVRKALPYTMAKAGCLLSGIAFYVTRFPESRYPGKFDLCGSHAIFHILVVCAAVTQLIGYLDAFDYAHANLTCSFYLNRAPH
ncbi:hemolysin-III family protein [Cadophora sp. MPI-SDFR-AT-0126]|nr:hemolysin-III family protein [Leotiomycetes sp. MPI-SDFR-AT-0126]